MRRPELPLVCWATLEITNIRERNRQFPFNRISDASTRSVVHSVDIHQLRSSAAVGLQQTSGRSGIWRQRGRPSAASQTQKDFLRYRRFAEKRRQLITILYTFRCLVNRVRKTLSFHLREKNDLVYPSSHHK